MSPLFNRRSAYVGDYWNQKVRDIIVPVNKYVSKQPVPFVPSSGFGAFGGMKPYDGGSSPFGRSVPYSGGNKVNWWKRVGLGFAMAAPWLIYEAGKLITSSVYLGNTAAQTVGAAVYEDKRHADMMEEAAYYRESSALTHAQTMEYLGVKQYYSGGYYGKDPYFD